MPNNNNNTAIEPKSKQRRSPHIGLSGVFLACMLVFVPRCAWATPQHEIKLATLAPENSSLANIFEEMNKELLLVTDGRLGFKLYAGFALGDEADVLRKLRIGLVHAATFTSTALTDVNKDLRVLQVPFLFSNYEQVDFIMGKVQEDLKKSFAKQGFEVLGFPELGFIYFLSKQPIAELSNLKGKRVWAQANAPMAKAFVDSVGVSNVAITAPDVLMALQTNLVDVVFNSPYYALITQWFTQVKYITDLPLSYIGAALLMNKKNYDQLPPDLQQHLKQVTAKYARMLVEKTRKDNTEALQVILGRGLQKITPNAQQAQGFRDLSEKVISELSADVLPKEFLKKIETELAEFRKTHPGQ